MRDSERTALIIGGVAVGVVLLSRGSAEARMAAPIVPDGEWQNALLSEYHPDAPESQQKMEGGKYDRNPRQKTLVITAQQHVSDKKRYPYVSVSSDLVLRGKKVPYGARVYFAAYPDYVFRLVDTGQRFYGPTKKIRKDGYEPFDIATDYGSSLGFAGRETKYWLDRNDTLPMYRPNVA